MKEVEVVFHLAALIAIPFSYHSPDSYIDTNVKGTLNIIQAARDNKVKRVLVTSTSEVNGTAQFVPITESHPKQPQSPYSAIKGGINNLTRYLASYFGPFQVRVNSISPGGIFDNQSDRFVHNYNNKVPMRRMGEPKDIVAAVNFLLSNESSYITGHNLVVDGGWSII